MDAGEFEKITNLGLGRAVLHLREHDSTPYREIILDACLHNKAYDPQIEGSRAEYVVDLMRSSGNLSFYAQEVIRSLTEEVNDWDTPHRFRIARLLAQSGDQFARQAMKAAFREKGVTLSDVAAEVLEL